MRRAWGVAPLLLAGLLLGCGINNASARYAEDFTIVRSGADYVIVRVSPKGSSEVHCLELHMERDQAKYSEIVATTSRLPKGACE